jgi:hypothetical protein
MDFGAFEFDTLKILKLPVFLAFNYDLTFQS